MAENLYYSGIDLQSVNKIVNSPTPTLAGDVANKGYVDSALSGVTGQLQYQGALDASTYTNELDNKSAGDYWIISLAGTVEGVEFAVGDLLLLNSDTTEASSSDFNKIDNTNLSEADVRALVSGGEGLTYNNSTGVFDINVDNSTIEITADSLNVKDGGITQAKLDSTLASKIVNGYAETLGDGTETSFSITHNLNSNDIIVNIYKLSTGESVQCDVLRTSVNEISVDATPAPASNDLRVLIQKVVLS